MSAAFLGWREVRDMWPLGHILLILKTAFTPDLVLIRKPHW